MLSDGSMEEKFGSRLIKLSHQCHINLVAIPENSLRKYIVDIYNFELGLFHDKNIEGLKQRPKLGG